MIGKQIFMDDNRHYPFKSGRVYSDIASKHFDEWDDGQKAFFRKETAAIRDKASAWKDKNRASNLDVEVLIAETGDLLRRIENK